MCAINRNKQNKREEKNDAMIMMKLGEDEMRAGSFKSSSKPLENETRSRQKVDVDRVHATRRQHCRLLEFQHDHQSM